MGSVIFSWSHSMNVFNKLQQKTFEEMSRLCIPWRLWIDMTLTKTVAQVCAVSFIIFIFVCIVHCNLSNNHFMTKIFEKYDFWEVWEVWFFMILYEWKGTKHLKKCLDYAYLNFGAHDPHQDSGTSGCESVFHNISVCLYFAFHFI